MSFKLSDVCLVVIAVFVVLIGLGVLPP